MDNIHGILLYEFTRLDPHKRVGLVTIQVYDIVGVVYGPQQVKDSLELFIKRREFPPGSGSIFCCIIDLSCCN